MLVGKADLNALLQILRVRPRQGAWYGLQCGFRMHVDCYRGLKSHMYAALPQLHASPVAEGRSYTAARANTLPRAGRQRDSH